MTSVVREPEVVTISPGAGHYAISWPPGSTCVPGILMPAVEVSKGEFLGARTSGIRSVRVEGFAIELQKVARPFQRRPNVQEMISRLALVTKALPCRSPRIKRASHLVPRYATTSVPNGRFLPRYVSISG